MLFYILTQWISFDQVISEKIVRTDPRLVNERDSGMVSQSNLISVSNQQGAPRRFAFVLIYAYFNSGVLLKMLGNRGRLK